MMKKSLLLIFFIWFNLGFINAQCFQSISAGDGHIVAIKSDGTLWLWGNNYQYQLGDGTKKDKNYPTQLDTSHSWKMAVAGQLYTLAIKKDGSLWAWGFNKYGELGLGDTLVRTTPTRVGSSKNWESVTTGFYFTIAKKTDGSLWAWGKNELSQLGDGSDISKRSPVQIGSSNDWNSIIAGGQHCFATKNDGTLWCWGSNLSGQLAKGSVFTVRNPVFFDSLKYWKSFNAGFDYNVAVKSDGTLWSWGNNNYGQLGDSTTVAKSVPKQVGFDNTWKRVFTGNSFCIGIKNDGTMWSWGVNVDGVLGDGSYVQSNQPKKIGTDTDWDNVQANTTCFATKSNGSIWAWGNNAGVKLVYSHGPNSNVPIFFACPAKSHVPNKINGVLFNSKNSSCIRGQNEKGILNGIIFGKKYRAIADSTGSYLMYADTGNIDLQTLLPSYLKPLFVDSKCPALGTYTIKLDSFGVDTSGFNFAQEFISAPLLQVEFTQFRLRRCFENLGSIKYCNIGTGDTDNVKVIVVLPPDVSFISSSITPSVNGKTLTFNIGVLKAGKCGTIDLITKVDCVNGLAGQTRCFNVAISPENRTYKDLVNKAGYDASKIKTEAFCETNNKIKFHITNEGNDMNDSSSYRIFQDALLAFNSKFKLRTNQTEVILLNATGHTYCIEADQSYLYPTNSNPTSSIENCGSNASAHWGNITKLPDYHEHVVYKEKCIIIRDSYDPNEKIVSPVGVGNSHIVKHKVSLNYTINFQNTGNDTAYQVVVTDTLSDLFNLGTLTPGGASNQYTVQFTGENATVINFIFDKINLVDSTTNEKKSHGFVSYSIMPYDSIPNGNSIKSAADIYFDYNLPVRTNTVITTIDDRLPATNFPIGIEETTTIDYPISSYTIIPNPAKNQARISGNGLSNVNLYSIFNSLGQKVMEGILMDGKTLIDISSFVQGIYFVNVNGTVKKLMIY